MQGGVQVTPFVSTVMDKGLTHVILQLAITVPYYLKLVAKNQICS